LNRDFWIEGKSSLWGAMDCVQGLECGKWELESESFGYSWDGGGGE